MIIKDYYIKKDSQNIINDIIKYLINNNINYLYIKESNEIHFDNYILRFKDIQNVKELLFDEFLGIVGTLCDTTYNEFLDYKDYSSHSTYKKNNFKEIKKTENVKIDTKGKSKKLNKKYTPTRKIYK